MTEESKSLVEINNYIWLPHEDENDQVKIQFKDLLNN